MSKGILTVISGPSGTGKGTIVNELLKDENTEISISCTTRAPRGQEVDGVNYFFKSQEEFEEMIKNNEFLEYAQVFGKYYGTPKEYVLKKLDAGKNVILEIDVQGAMQIKENFPKATLVFIAPPSLKVLYDRLAGRGTETKELVNKRFSMAKSELKFADKYDYVVINDDLQTAVKDVKCIFKAGKLASRSNEIINKLLDEEV